MSRRSAGWPWVLLGLILGLVIAALVGLFVAAPQALLHHEASDLERTYGSAMVSLAARFNVPQRLPDAGPQAAKRGRQAYADSCAQCHGAVGDGKGVIGQTTFPPATDLTSSEVRNRSDAELFWIIKNGLGFTAMPAYEQQYKDPDVSALVSYVRALQRASQ